MLLLLVATQPALAESSTVNLSLVLNDVYAPLNAKGDGDLIFWSQAQLLAYVDEALTRFARRTGAYIERNTDLVTIETAGQYEFPEKHFAVIQLDLDGRTLRVRTIMELEARDSQWPSTTATHDRPVEAFAQDVEGMTKLVLYPAPDVGETPINMLRAIIPQRDNLSIADTPPILRDYFTLNAIMKARQKESQGSMDEVVPWLQQVLGVIESTAVDLWGLD